MNGSKYLLIIKARFLRGLSPNKIGPNEARVAYDALISFLAIFFLSIYFNNFEPSTWEWKLFFLPMFLCASNLVLGIYGTNRYGSWIKKAILIILSLFLTSIFSLYLSINSNFIVLWLALVTIPLIIPRVILGLPYARHKHLIASATKKKGPILIVGGAGYIGTHVVERLLESGNFVRVLDSLMYGLEPLTDFLKHPNFELIVGDSTDIAKLTEAMKDISTVIHLAGLVGDPACAVDPVFTRHTNIISTKVVKEVAQSMGVNKFIFASSCSVYGVTDTQVNEDGPLNPVSLYAQTKIDSENELLATARDDFAVTILRFATVFGHSRRPRFDLVANLFTAQGMQDGNFTVTGSNQWRPFIHVRDLSYAIQLVVNANEKLVHGQIFNVGGENLNLTIGDLGKIISNIIIKERDIKVFTKDDIADTRNYSVAFKKIHEILGFVPTETMESGIKEMISNIKLGRYGDYRNPKFSNLLMTREKATEFNASPSKTIYTPITEFRKIN